MTLMDDVIASDQTHPTNGTKGTLVRVKSTGMFALLTGPGAYMSVPQAWALRVAKDQIRDAPMTDAIQEACIARAEQLQMSAYAVAKACNGAISEIHIKDFLSRRSSMGSHKLQHVIKALGLRLVAEDQ